MNFFGEQRLRKRRSLILYTLFFVVTLLNAIFFGFLFALILKYFLGYLSKTLWILSGFIVVLIFLLGSLIEKRRLKAGGRAVANRVGAVRLFIDNSNQHMDTGKEVVYASVSDHDPSPFSNNNESKVRYTKRHIAVKNPKDFPAVYKRLYDLSYQMSVAAGISMPILYVLPNEKGINAFVAGYTEEDTVLIVTQGALEKLSDEGLYGLIAHQYSHILNDDTRFNLKIMVVLGGLQLLYDISDPIGSNARRGGYYDAVDSQSYDFLDPNTKLSSIDKKGDKLAAKTQHIVSPDQWVSHWRQEPAMPSSQPIQSTPYTEWSILKFLTAPSMASAQFIKHHFNLQRFLLADATSLQLTRSYAIVETLKEIHKDPVGSRLISTPNISSLSHFCFAESRTDFLNIALFSTHPTIEQRIESVNEGEYIALAMQMAKQNLVKQNMVKEMQRQKQRGELYAFKEPNTSTKPDIDYVETPDEIIDGRLQTDHFKTEIAEQTGASEYLYPHIAKMQKDIPAGEYINISHLKQFNLPKVITQYLFQPLGLLSLVESVMLCHVYKRLDPIANYDLAQIWVARNNDDKRIIPHKLNTELLACVATFDRRLDSVLIEMALKKLKGFNLSEDDEQISAQEQKALYQNIKELEISKKKMSERQLKQKATCTLRKYQMAMTALLSEGEKNSENEPDNDVTDAHLNSDNISRKNIDSDNINKEDTNKASALKPNASMVDLSVNAMPVSSLWQALHLMQLLEVLGSVLGQSPTQIQPSSLIESVLSKQVYKQVSCVEDLTHLERSDLAVSLSILLLMTQLLKVQFGVQAFGIHTLDSDKDKFISSLQRLARLVDIPASVTEYYCKNWLYGYLKNGNFQDNGLQNDGLVGSNLPNDNLQDDDLLKNDLLDNKSNNNCKLSLFDIMGIVYHIKQSFDDENGGHKKANNLLSTFYTITLHNGILSQDEYDILTLLAMQWLGARQLIE